MLNLYLAARSGAALRLDAVVEFLKENGFIGELSTEVEYPPGPDAARLFDANAHEELLPAELTFEALRVVERPRAVFIPELQPVEFFRGATCTRCGDDIDLEPLGRALAEIAFRPVARFTYTCPGCRDALTVADIDFGQPTSVTRHWIYLEAVGTSRLASRVVDAMSKVAGAPLVVIPERPEPEFNEPAVLRKQGRRGGWGK